MNWQKLYNPLMAALLRSPLHRMMGGLMLITVTGRKSGRAITTPVNYAHIDGSMVVFSQASRTWWRNLRGGAPVTLHLRGHDQEARAEACEDAETVAADLHAFLQQHPNLAKPFGVQPDASGAITRDAVVQAAAGRVTIHIRPT